MNRLIRKRTYIHPIEEMYISQGTLKWRCNYCKHIITVWAGTRRAWDYCPKCKIKPTKWIDEQLNAL